MADVDVSEIGSLAPALLQRVEAGEEITISVDGRPVAVLVRIERPRWLPRDEFVRLITRHQADPDLRRDLQELLDPPASDA